MNTWKEFIASESEKPYYKNIVKTIQTDASTSLVYPERKNIFNAFALCPINKTKIVILGQDPYFNPGEAHGLSFSVPDGVSIPPSLRNIYKEIDSDLGIKPVSHGNLASWAKQGVLLLNSSLTVLQGKPGSHKDIGWHTFTDAAISLLNEQDQPIVFMLWGAHAKKKRALVTNPKHLILEAAHPSPLAAFNGFFGCKHFSKANQFLIQNNLTPIDWSLEKNVPTSIALDTSNNAP